MILNRLALAALCVLPALATRLPAPGTPIVATFMYACDSEEPRPKLTTHYTGEGRPQPKPKDAPVWLYEKGQEPGRAFEVIGEVQVLSSSSRTGPDVLKDWAIRGARELGGDAVVAVVVDDAGSVSPKAGPVGLLHLKASVARWQ